MRIAGRGAVYLTVVLMILGSSAGCVSQDAGCDVKVNGDFGAPVTLDGTCVNPPSGDRVVTLKEGTGNAITEGQTVLFRATSFDSRNAKIVDPYNSGHLRLAEVTEAEMGELASVLPGIKEGGRLLITHPGLVVENKSAAEIVVVDILYSIASGQAAQLPETLPKGMPSVGVADGGGPSVNATGEGIPELAVVPLVIGAGAQVPIGAHIFAQYAIYDTAGQIIDTSWNGGKPVMIDLENVMKGLGSGLVDQRVGSRVVVLIPSSQAQGTGDRIAVVDILGISDESIHATPSTDAGSGK